MCSALLGICTVTVSNNNIMNGKDGYAIKNSVHEYVKLILKNNHICPINHVYPIVKPTIAATRGNPNIRATSRKQSQET